MHFPPMPVHPESQHDFTKQRDWTKFWAAKPYVERAKTVEYVNLLKNKIDIPPLICPKDTHTIIAAADPGQGGFWTMVTAWRLIDMVPTCHIMHYDFLPSWDALTTFVFNTTYTVANRENDYRRIWRFGVDTGGLESQQR